MLRFIIYLLILGSGVALSIYVGQTNDYFTAPTFSLGIILYMVSSTTVVYFLLYQKSGSMFTQMYLLTIVLKMLTGSIIIILIINADLAAASANAILFISSYLLFTALEVIFLYRNMNHRTNKTE